MPSKGRCEAQDWDWGDAFQVKGWRELMKDGVDKGEERD